MMSMYVVMQGEYYENSTVHGVYSTLEKAKAAGRTVWDSHDKFHDYVEVYRVMLDEAPQEVAEPIWARYSGGTVDE
jgi:hypothetical protein